MIPALLEALRLKRLPRAGWVRAGIANPESVAAHSWGVAWLVLVLLPSHLNRGLALSYAVLHDLPEVRVGDITPHDGVPRHQKAERELLAMNAMTQGLPEHLITLFTDYEAQDDPESQFVRQLDRLDMALQAVAYAPESSTELLEFLDSADKGITAPGLRKLMGELRASLDG